MHKSDTVGTMNHIRAGVRALAGVCALTAASGAQAATQAGTGKAITLRALSIVKLRDLDFGRVISGTRAGTVSINANNGVRRTTGGVVAAGGTPLTAQFYTYATGNQTLQISRGPLPVLTRTGGGGSMTVMLLSFNGPAVRVIGASGLLDLRVGGTLAVPANQPDGLYSGSFNITVTYF